MRTTDKLGFKLIIREPNVAERTVVVCPRYDGLKIKWSRPNGKMYYQKELSGTIKFWGVDFNVVNKCALRTKFTLVVYELKKGEIARADFSKTDCKWDINHAECDVDVSSWNPYKKIEAAKDNEYNLVRLGLLKNTLNFYVYPQNQVYFQEDNKISLFGGLPIGTQTGVTPTHDSTLETSMHFGKYAVCGALSWNIGDGVVVNGSASFKYSLDDFNGSTTTITPTYGRSLGHTYKCMLVGNGTLTNASYQVFIGYYRNARTIDNVFLLNHYFTIILGIFPYNSNINPFYITADDVQEFDTLYGYTSSIWNVGGVTPINIYWSANTRFWAVYAGSTTRQKLDGYLMPSDDITASFNNNYRSRFATFLGTYPYLTQSFIKNHIAVSSRTSSEPTEYGRVENQNVYYNTPDDTQEWMPVCTESWFEGFSVWVGECSVSQLISSEFEDSATIQDFYLLGDAIKAVINEIDPDLHFEQDTTHSQFLFGTTNPVGGVQQGALYISQKSNVLNLGYDYPAWQAPITWGKIENLLNNAFNCYWEIYEDNGERHLRIEHRTFFENGGTYDGSSLAQMIDLRTIYRTSNRTPFSDKTNRWEWDKEGGSTSSRANRYEYGWMDTQSAIFDGETIEVPEEHQLFEDERVEERKIDWFSSDIDFLTSVQAECSSDGFVLVMESLSTDGWIITDNPNYSGQNYELSLEYLQPKYLLAGIYSTTVKIGDNTYPNTFTSRMRKAEIEFNIPEGVNIEAGDIIWTEAGKGWSEALELDLSSGKWTATVRYENE